MKPIIKITYKFIICIFLSITIQSCTPDQNIETKNLEKFIISKVLEDAPYIAQLEAIYMINYIYYKDKAWYQDDEAYIRDDEAKVYYGFNINKSKISIEKISNKMILQVKLPKPEQISIDRKIKSLKTNDQNTKVNFNDKQVDLELLITTRLNTIIKQYEPKNFKLAQSATRQYFEAIANRYNLDLQIEFN
jgi:hypothetical protein